MKIEIINGPNLNLLGIREPEIYGKETLSDIENKIREALADIEVELSFNQSNSEGELINFIHSAAFEKKVSGIILNAGAYSHYSYAIADAIASLQIPVIEVHISNTQSRAEPHRHKSVIGGVCKGRIEGFGWFGYVLAALCISRQES